MMLKKSMEEAQRGHQQVQPPDKLRPQQQDDNFAMNVHTNVSETVAQYQPQPPQQQLHQPQQAQIQGQQQQQQQQQQQIQSFQQRHMGTQQQQYQQHQPPPQQQQQQQQQPSQFITQSYNSWQEQNRAAETANNDLFLLPSTSIPPSVLASMYNKDKPARAHAGKLSAKHSARKSKKSITASSKSPQDVLDSILQQRGYSIKRIKADDAGYEAVPSALQLASFGTHLVRAVHTSDTDTLSSLLECGLSPNPCNQFRDSIIDLVCKRANETVFQCLLNHGSELQVVDGFGRTPLHHAAWASEFSRFIVEAILQRDPIQLFIEDKHGQTPLEYVRKDLYLDWIEFLDDCASTYWPIGGDPPRLVPPREGRPAGHVEDPANAISVTLAAMVSAGNVTPQQVLQMSENDRRTFTNDSSVVG